MAYVDYIDLAVCCSRKAVKLNHSITGIRSVPDTKAHGANMGPIWGLQDPCGPHVDPLNFAIWDVLLLGFSVALLVT